MDTLKYKLLKNFVSKDLCLYLSSFCFRFLHNLPKDASVPNSVAFHSWRSEIFQNITHYLKPYVEKETKLKLKPIYAFNRIYYGGSFLSKHIDRDSCEISLTITLNYNYSNKNYEWPFHIEDKKFVLDIGDAILYNGPKYEHWRNTLNLPETDWHHQLFVHYVNADGPYNLLEEELSLDMIKKNKDLTENYE